MGNNKKSIFAVLLCLCIVVCGLYFGSKAIFPLQYEEEIRNWSTAYEVDPYLVMGIIRAESSFQADAVSSANAMGLMQLTGETAAQIADWLEITDFKQEQLFDANCNIRFGTRYVQWLLEQFDGDLKNTLAAYNAGIGTVKNWLANEDFSTDGTTLHTIPYKETADFVTRVTTYQQIYQLLYPS